MLITSIVSPIEEKWRLLEELRKLNLKTKEGQERAKDILRRLIVMRIVKY
jgi:hypothetical protein